MKKRIHKGCVSKEAFNNLSKEMANIQTALTSLRFSSDRERREFDITLANKDLTINILHGRVDALLFLSVLGHNDAKTKRNEIEFLKNNKDSVQMAVNPEWEKRK